VFERVAALAVDGLVIIPLVGKGSNHLSVREGPVPENDVLGPFDVTQDLCAPTRSSWSADAVWSRGAPGRREQGKIREVLIEHSCYSKQ